MRHGYDENGTLYVQESNDDGKTWQDIDAPEGTSSVPVGEIIDGAAATVTGYSGKPSRKFQNEVSDKVSAIDRRNADVLEKYARPEESKQRSAIAKEIYAGMPWYKSIPTSIGIGATEKVKDMMHGLADFGDFIIDQATPGGDLEALKRSAERYKKRDERKDTMKELMEQTPIGSLVGGALPYAAIDAAIAPNIAIKGIAGLSPAMNGLLANVGKLTTSGALGGAIDSENTIGMGAIAGGAGALIGTMMGRGLERSRNVNNATDNETINWWKKKGFKPTPGMTTGIEQMQRDTAAMKRDPRLSPVFGEYDAKNEAVIAKVAGDAMGLDMKGQTAITPEMLRKHFSSKGADFDEVERNIIGTLDPSAVGPVVSQIQANAPLLNNSTVSKLNAIKADFEEIQGRPFNAMAYKNVKNKIKSVMADMEPGSSTRDTMGHAIASQMLNLWEDSFHSAMLPGASRKLSKLQEEYAITNKLIDNGLRPNGTIDTARIADDLLNTDARRLLTARGGNIKSLQQIARLNEVLGKQADAGINSSDNVSKPAIPFMPVTSSAYEPGVLSRIKVAAHMNGYPRKTGYLNAPRGSTTKYFPSLIQSDLPEGSVESLPDWAKQGINLLKSAKDGASNYLDEYSKKQKK